MFNAKAILFACASLFALAAAAPASAQDEAQPNPFGAAMPAEQAEAASPFAPENPNANRDSGTTAPVADSAPVSDAAPAEAGSASPFDSILAVPQESAGAEDRNAPDSAAPVFQLSNAGGDRDAGIVGTNPTPDFLRQYYAKNAEIALKRLELEAARLQAETDKITGAQAMREAAAAANMADSGPAEPEDDTSTLPGVAAIIGAKGALKAELAVDGGGRMVARPGDMLPGGWRLARIERSAVYVVSPRTGTEYVLSGASSPESAAQSGFSPVSDVMPPAAQSSNASSGGDIIIAPAE